MEDMTTLNVRIPKDLKKAFDEVCAEKDTTASQAIRAFIRDFVAKNAQGDLLRKKS